MQSKQFFNANRLLERYNKLKQPYQMVIFFVPFILLVHAVFWGLISFMPGGFNAPGFYDAIAINRNPVKVVVTDKTKIMKNVDTIVAGITDGKSATDFKAKDYSPFCSIMDQGGELLVHAAFAGMNVKRSAPYIYNEITKGTVEGIWVEYPVRGKLTHVYVKRTKNNLFVSSGYSKK
jgi:hypothetical protein